MVRCPRCGLRLNDAKPLCPVHGPTIVELVAPHEITQEVPSPVDAKIPGALAERGYRLVNVLGRGGFGVVYAAERLHDGQRVAIKLALSGQPQTSIALEREASALRRVGAPHVPTVHESGELLDRFYVVLEHIDAPTLAERLISKDRPPLSLARVAQIAEAIMGPLEAIHARGLVHRDLKPENIFLSDDGSATIIDFGLAKHESAQPELLSHTAQPEDIGTDEYMSPEQCDGLSDSDRRSDIYSLGVLLYELLSGAPPFWGKSTDVREAHRSRRPAPLVSKVGCSPELDAVVRRCLAKERKRRFDDVAALRRALHEAIATGAPAQIAPVTQAREAPSPRPAGSAAAGQREKRTMGLVFFESSQDLAAIQAAVTASGGQIVQTNGAQHVAAFGHDLGDNPARIALAAAQQLFNIKLAPRLCVDVATVSVQLRGDGSRRIFSPVLAKRERFPMAIDQLGVMLTKAAAEVLPDLEIVVAAGRPDRFQLVLSETANESTTFGIQTAPLLGRDELLRTLMESAQLAFTSPAPTLVTIVGEAGYGRTHLSSVLSERVDHLLPLESIRMTASEGMFGSGSPLLRNLLRRLLDLPESAPPDGGRQLFMQHLGKPMGEQVWAAAALALGWVDAQHADVRRLAAAPGALRLAAARAAGEALRARARKKPVALVLDDAHLADDVTLDALEYATLREGAAPIWACVLVRPTFVRSRPAWGGRAGRSERHTLAPLEATQAMELARHLLYPVEYAPPQALARLAERTQGVPRLLVELVRGLKRDGLVRQSERGTGYYLATDALEKLPDLPIVEWNARREFDALPPQLAAQARLASVLGASFTVREVEHLLEILERQGLTEDVQLDPGVGTQRLIDAGMLVRHRSGLIDFRHALLRDTIYQLVPNEQRKRLHAAAFEMYQAIGMPGEQRLPRLALHAARSGKLDAAADAYLALARRALEAHAYIEAEVAFGRALENLDDGDERVIAAARGRGLMRFRLSRHEDALKDLRRARELAQAKGDRESEFESLLDEATVLDWTMDWTQSAARVRSAEALGPMDSELLSVRLAQAVARVHQRLGEAEAAVQRGTAAIERARKLGDDGYESFVTAGMLVAFDCAHLGRLDEAERHFAEVIEAAQAHADLHHLGGTYINRSALWMARKQLDRVFEDFRNATRIAREIGSPVLEYWSLLNQAEIEYYLEELDRADAHTQRALDLVREMWGELSRDVRTRQLLLARIALYRGEPDQARVLLERMRTGQAEARAEKLEEVEFIGIDQALFEMVELACRDADDTEWQLFEERWSSLEKLPNEETELIEMRSLCAFRRGERLRSRALFDRAIALSRAKSSMLTERLTRRYAKLFLQPS